MELVENDVFVPAFFNRKVRRVVTILDSGVVAYSTGGNGIHYCKLRTLKRWVTSSGAKKLARLDAPSHTTGQSSVANSIHHS